MLHKVLQAFLLAGGDLLIYDDTEVLEEKEVGLADALSELGLSDFPIEDFAADLGYFDAREEPCVDEFVVVSVWARLDLMVEE